MATNLNISENQERVSLSVRSGGLLRTITPDNGSPYYVGARAYVTQNEDGATVTVIDKDGTTTANIYDGTDGTDGIGIADISQTSTSGNVDTYTITYSNGDATTFNVTNGVDGQDGTDGVDGYSPSATVSKVGTTATITITDKDGTTTAEVHDGGASAFVAEFNVTTYADVKDAYDNDAILICTVDDSGNPMVLQFVYFDVANEIFYFAMPMSDGWLWTQLSNADGWDMGQWYFASTDVATQLADGLMSALDKQKLDGIASGAEVNVQSDWNQSVNTADDYIKNKPSIPTITDTYSGTSSDGMSGKAVKSAIDALDGIISGSAGSGKTLTAFSQTDGKVSATFGNISITKSQVSDFPSLATVATSGDYDDLTDKPAIHNVPSGGTSGQVLAKDSNDDYDLTWVNQSGGGGGGEIVYCTCTDSASTVAKTATVVSGTFASLDTGSQVAVKFTYTNTATNPTLNVAGTGAKGIRRGGTAYVGTNANESWNAGTVVFLLYDGVDWQIVGWLNTTYNGGTGTEIVAGTSALNKVWSPQQINYGIDGMSTATPTASKISKFDSSAHMNSTDMTSQEVSDFVDGLDAQGGAKEWLKIFDQTFALNTSKAYSIPTGAQDLYIDVSATISSVVRHGVFNIPVVAVSNQEEAYYIGDYESSSYSAAILIKLSKTSVLIWSLQFNGSAQSSGHVVIYAR